MLIYVNVIKKILNVDIISSHTQQLVNAKICSCLQQNTLLYK